MMSRPVTGLPYSVGMYVITNVVPGFPAGSRTPLVGLTENSYADSAAKNASNSAYAGVAFVKRKATDADLFNGDSIKMRSSTSGSDTSILTSNRHRPAPACDTTKLHIALKGRSGRKRTFKAICSWDPPIR